MDFEQVGSMALIAHVLSKEGATELELVLADRLVQAYAEIEDLCISIGKSEGLAVVQNAGGADGRDT
jgi:hypothetical protein